MQNVRSRVSEGRGVAEASSELAIISLDRPESANSFDTDLAEHLYQQLRAAVDAPEVRAILLRSNGRSFSAGGDLRSIASAGEDRAAYMEALISAAHRAILTIAETPKLVISAVRGAAAGFGLSLVLASDIAVAGKSATLSAAYPKVGLSPDGGMSYFLPRLAGRRRAQEILFLGQSISAQDGVGLGLLTMLVEDEVLDEKAIEIATEVANGPSAALGRTKRLLGDVAALSAQLDQEAREIVASSISEDGREGVRAFLERRQPMFTGQ